MLAEIRFFDVVLALHVLFSIAAFGVMFTYPVILRMGERDDRSHLPFALRVIDETAFKFIYIGGLVPGLTGIYQTWKGGWDLFEHNWLLISVILYVLLYVIALLLLVPARRAMIAEADHLVKHRGPDGALELNPWYRSQERQVAMSGLLLILIFAAIVFLMVVKPSG